MNPMAILSALGMGGSGAAGGSAAGTIAGGTAGAAGAAEGGGTLSSILGSLAAPPPGPGTQTTFPEVPRQMNPAFTQMIMQALMQPQQGGEQPNLGALLAGR